MCDLIHQTITLLQVWIFTH